MTHKNGIHVLFIMSALFFGACSKVDNPVSTPPEQADTASYFRVSVYGTEPGNAARYALLSIEDKDGQVVAANKKVSISFAQGVATTNKFELAPGDYKLTKLILVKATDTAVYAIPRANSEQAENVDVPLPVNFTIARRVVNDAALQALKIQESQTPAVYGYSKDDFGFQPFISLSLSLGITVGNVLYDSLSGRLHVVATNDAGERWTREIELRQGATPVQVPETYRQFVFRVNKWNVVAEKQYSRQELASGMSINLESSRLAKKLWEERVYTETVAGLVPDSRTEFRYNAQDKLQEVRFYQKKLQVEGLHLTFIHKFNYAGSMLESIERFAPDNVKNGSSIFEYNAGRIANVQHTSYDQQTFSAYEYSQEGRYKIIQGDYLLHNGNSMVYTLKFLNGNKVSDFAQTSTGGTESGVYEYDDYINPKHQLGWEDLYLTNASRSNLVKEQKNYGGSIPSVVPYRFEYVYDADGYPSTVHISYRGYTSKEHLYRIKKEYIYQ